MDAQAEAPRSDTALTYTVSEPSEDSKPESDKVSENKKQPFLKSFLINYKRETNNNLFDVVLNICSIILSFPDYK